MRTRIAPLLAAATVATAVVMVPEVPASAQSLDTVHCTASCSVMLGTNSSHNLHLSTTGLQNFHNVVYILDTDTGVYVYNNQHQWSYRDTDVWVGGLYGQHYVADVYCPSCAYPDQKLYLSNF